MSTATKLMAAPYYGLFLLEEWVAFDEPDVAKVPYCVWDRAIRDSESAASGDLKVGDIHWKWKVVPQVLLSEPPKDFLDTTREYFETTMRLQKRIADNDRKMTRQLALSLKLLLEARTALDALSEK